MFTTLLLTALTGLPAAQDKKPQAKLQAPQKLELFAGEDWYRKLDWQEQNLTGELTKVERGKDDPVSSRFNPYRISFWVTIQEVNYVEIKSDVGYIGSVDRPIPFEKKTRELAKELTREIFVAGKDKILDQFVGKTVTVTGKWVTLESEGRQQHEIWPADIEVADRTHPVNAARTRTQDIKLKIHAKAAWPFASDNDKKGKQLVLRSAADLVNSSPPKPNITEKKATEELAKAFKVNTIDWDKQMVVVVTAGQKPTGGYQIDIQSITTAGKDATVNWKLTSPQGIAIQVLTHPSVMVLVDRVAGEVKFDPPIK